MQKISISFYIVFFALIALVHSKITAAGRRPLRVASSSLDETTRKTLEVKDDLLHARLDNIFKNAQSSVEAITCAGTNTQSARDARHAIIVAARWDMFSVYDEMIQGGCVVFKGNKNKVAFIKMAMKMLSGFFVRLDKLDGHNNCLERSALFDSALFK